ncbi:MAG: peptide MFS transporter [Saprospiraceae bacterium]|nr:peptide MFS transporter [Saprospiraceae bacterium]
MHPYTIMGIAWAACIVWIAFVIFTNKKAHPKALFYLFFVEMWERFSYYGMRALLVLYMTKGFLDYSTGDAYGAYGAYGAMVYATPLIGGLLSEKFMGYRKAIMWGAILMMIGHFLMAFEHEYIFLTALAMLIMGNGFFKPNISSMIGKFYAKKDPRRDGAFTIFYMGINIGAFLSGLTCGAIGEIEGWHYGFSLAGFGMLVGLIIFYMAQKSGALEDKGFAPHEVKEIEQPDVHEDDRVQKFEKVEGATAPTFMGLPVNILIYIGSLLAIPLIWLLIKGHGVLDFILLGVLLGMFGYLIFVSTTYEKVQRQRIWVILTLFIATIIFWTFFELAGSALTVFTDNNVDLNNSFLTTTMFQSVNPFFIMVFAPIFSWMWIKMSQKNIEPPAPVKFGIGLILLGLGFLVLNLGSGAAKGGLIPAMFMIFLYLLHTLGELTLSPVGLSLVTKLAPLKIVGFVMGFWLMASSAAHQAGSTIAKMTEVDMSILLEDTTRSNAFKERLTNLDVQKVFFENKDFYNLYISDLSEKTVKKNPKLKDKLAKLETLVNGDTTLIKKYRDGHSVRDFIVSDFFITEINKGKAKPEYFAASLINKKIAEEAAAATNEVHQEKLENKSKVSFLTKDASLAVYLTDTNLMVAQIDTSLATPSTAPVDVKAQNGGMIIVSKSADVVAVQMDTVVVAAKVVPNKLVAKGSMVIIDKSSTEPKVMTGEEIATAMDVSPTTTVQTAIAEDTLVICLSVFNILGFIAIGAGILLFVLAFFITRWMHGIK